MQEYWVNVYLRPDGTTVNGVQHPSREAAAKVVGAREGVLLIDALKIPRLRRL